MGTEQKQSTSPHRLALSPSLITSHCFLLSLLLLSSDRIVQPRPGWEQRCTYGNRDEGRVPFKSLFHLNCHQRIREAVGLRKQTTLGSYHKYGLPLDSSRPVSTFIPSINACAFQVTSGAPRPWGCFSPLLPAQLVRLPMALAPKWPEVKNPSRLWWPCNGWAQTQCLVVRPQERARQSRAVGVAGGAESSDSAFINRGNANKCEKAFEDAFLLSIHEQPRKSIRDFFFLASVIRHLSQTGENSTTQFSVQQFQQVHYKEWNC